MTLTVSVVSHGHGDTLLPLLEQLAHQRPPGLRRVIVTFNRPEAQAQAAVAGADWPFELLVRANATPAGFGANHNRAFEHDARQPGGASPVFVVLNPDLSWDGDPLGACVRALRADPRAGCAYPQQTDAAGVPQDYARRLPTPRRLLARHLGGRRHECAPGEAPDWVSGAFLALRHEAFAQIGGFDERYRMYCEDVDLCLRLRLAGWRLVAADASVVHAAQRASRRDLRHLLWHLRSLWRLWRSPAWAGIARGRQRADAP